MAGVQLYQPGGAGTLNAAGAQHPAPVDIEVGLLCQLSLVGASTTTYRWTLTKPGGSSSVLSSTTSSGPSFLPDVEGGSYSIHLFDINENEYILDIVTPTSGGGGGGGGGGSIGSTYASYAAVRAVAAISAPAASAIMVACRETDNDGAGGIFAYDAADTTSADNDGTILVGNAGERYKRIFSGSLDIRWFGGKADALGSGGTDNTAALAAALAVGKSIYFPSGSGLAYRFADTIDLTNVVELFGDGSSNSSYLTMSALIFPKGSCGIFVHRDLCSGSYIHDLFLDGTGNWVAPPGSFLKRWAKWAPSTVYAVGDIVIPPQWTLPGYALRCTDPGTSAATEPADWNDWANFPEDFVGHAGPWTDGGVVWELLTDAHGIRLETTLVKLHRLYIRGFSNNGINAVCEDAGGSNANLSDIDDVMIEYNGGHGVSFAGTDSNASSFKKLTVDFNGQFGVLDRSFLQNGHFGHHTVGNEGGMPYWINGSAESLYSEGGDGAGYFYGNGLKGGFVSDGTIDTYRTPWTAGEAVSAGLTYRAPTVRNGYYYICQTSGTTHATTEPTWPKGAGRTVTDNGAVWRCFGIHPPFRERPSIKQGAVMQNTEVRNSLNSHRVMLGLGLPPASEVGYNGLLTFQSFTNGDIARDVYALSYDDTDSWYIKQGYTDAIMGWYGVGVANTRGLHPQFTYFPYGVTIGRYIGGNNSIGTGAGDFGARFTAGNALPTDGLWFKGHVHWHADAAAGEPTFWQCVQAGGWSNATRSNNAPVARLLSGIRTLIEPTAGHVWECTVGGTTSGTPPAFVAGNDYVETGGVTWTYRGVEPPLFEAVYTSFRGSGSPESSVSALVGQTYERSNGDAYSSIYVKTAGSGNTGWKPLATEPDGTIHTVAQRNNPSFFTSTAWTLDEYGRVTCTSTAGDSAIFTLELPNGALLTSVVVWAHGGGNAALPAVMPKFTVRTLTIDDNSTVSESAATDGSANVTVYNAMHSITKSGLSIDVNNTNKRYTVQFESESGANATAGYTITAVVCGITLTVIDKQAS